MIDPRLELLLQSSLRHLVVETGLALDDCESRLSALASASEDAEHRAALGAARLDLQAQCSAIALSLGEELRRRVHDDLQRAPSDPVTTGQADWSDLRLMDDAEIEQTVTVSRLIRMLEACTEAQLQELQALFATLQGLPSDDETFPLRPAVVCKAMLAAIGHHVVSEASQGALARVLTDLVAPRLKGVFEALLQRCHQQGVKAAPLAVRKPGGGPTTTSGALSGALPSQGGTPWAGAGSDAPPFTRAEQQATQQALSDLFGVSVPASLPGELAQPPLSGPQQRLAEQNMLGLMRRLHRSAGGLDGGGEAGGGAGAIAGAAAAFNANVIRAHRDELLHASGGTPLDQMVIDIVSTLFDQVLSDPKVPPQMARQIGRLQLPVLRVALRDPSFFSSRKHPVRRLINRMATIATGFDGLDEGPGQECIQVVDDLVGSIVEGDFDRVDLYESKLGQLEAFLQTQAAREAHELHGIAQMLAAREADLRVQQRFMQQVQHELQAVQAPDFLKVFLCQIWTQVQVLVAARQGADSAQAQRMREVAQELVLSVQPQGNPSLRMAFLRMLPPLMKDLNAGLDLIQWAPEARDAFLGQLLPLHSEALKTAPAHDLTTRLLTQSLRKVGQLAIPTREAAAQQALPEAWGRTDAPDLSMAHAITAVEAPGWVAEGALLQGDLDINLSADTDPDLDRIHIELPLDAPAAPTAGSQLVHHIRAGSAYQMVLQGQWKKVRLTWVSEGRTFFIFGHGPQKSRETISLTGRTLAKLCESGRFRAFEQAELLERATLRARRQLAALKTAA